ncbi:sensor domain-containing protein [Thioalkalivibrio paradoxus]|uniref:Diguanylate cyclase n=1 Tax=Thioalkalivibrio paradoxus ARh 1 TaxID=713585 RepID=W0DKL7_9GAMM|nr:EAL domain-containing protein [Thioalkalivibrio paradoxus]AHE97548.1 diguanylate cyclase [Thioalkalivibrio paradoxus ARh 1]
MQQDPPVGSDAPERAAGDSADAAVSPEGFSAESLLRCYRELFDRAPVGYLVVDSRGRVLKVNETGSLLFSIEPTKLLGRRIGVMVAQSERSRLRRFLASVFDEAGDQTQEITLATRGNPMTWVRLQARADGMGHRALIVATDFRDLGVSPDEMQIAVSVYRVLDHAVMIADGENRIVSVNPRFTEITGYPPDEAIERKTNLLKSGRQDDAFYQRMWHALETRGRWQGELWNRRKNGEEFLESLSIHTLHDREGRVLRRVALFSDITDQRRAVEEAQRQANHDPLSGLPNRNLFLDRLEQEVRKGQRNARSVALLYLDLDHFKEVNDTLGHQAGDRLLQEVARRIRASVRETDTVARLGGDEFTVIMGDLTDFNRVDLVAQEIVDALARPFPLGSEVVQVSASLGIAFFPADADGSAELVDHADRAMYAAKKAGRNRYQYFTPQLQSSLRERHRRIAELRNALSNRQLQVYLQPVVDLLSGETRLLEALLRWQHPDDGLILPAQFLPLAEDIGIMGEIGDLVFEQVSAVVGAAEPSHAENPVRIAINQSLRELCHGRGERGWVGYLEEYGLPLDRVVFEITERTLLEGGTMVESQVCREIEQGVSVALDDFGTGQSSMTCLERIPFEYVKLDGSVVRRLPHDRPARAFLEAVIVLTGSLGIRLIAEGVETEAERDYLRASGCRFAQGFLLGPPVPAEFCRYLSGGAPADPRLPRGEG